MSLNSSTKTEHTGAKNGGGFWGPRKQAKQITKIIRRRQGKQQSKSSQEPKI